MFLRAAAFLADAFAARFLGGEIGDVIPPDPGPDPQPPIVLPLGGISKHRARRRILMPDGRILIPADDQAYRRAVEQIVAGLPQKAPEPSRKARKRLAKAVIHPERVKPAPPIHTLPSEFYTALEFNRTGVLNYLAVQSAYRAWLDEQDEEEAITLLLVN